MAITRSTNTAVLLLIGLAMWGLVTAGSAQANLIVNGDFETGVAAPWIFSGNVAVTGPASADFWFGGGSTAQNGNFAAVFNAGDTTPNGVISQTFATVVGEIYAVQFDYGASQGGTQTIIASILGSDGTTVLPGGGAFADANPPPVLDTHNFSFTADGNQATLRFTDSAANQTISLDGILDNVSVDGAVRAVPEPATLALLAIGLAGLGFSRRRRR